MTVYSAAAQALYFDAVRTQCGHVFCRACVEKGESCAICGADCRPLQSDDDMQGALSGSFQYPLRQTWQPWTCLPD